MKINEVEQAVGITKKNIRFYEKEGLLHPARNMENGYREYSVQDVEELKKIKLLRKLAIPLEEIRHLQSGQLLLEDGLRRHLITLERERKNLEQIWKFCQHMQDGNSQMDTLDAARYLEEMEQMEQEGMRFMDVKQMDQKKKKWKGAILAAVAGVAFCLWFMAMMVLALMEEPLTFPEIWLLLTFVIAPVVVAACIVYALLQRKREIQEGEEDAAAKY
ncbi:MAG: MerR family transcriptional regulator [Lachnospiraceae bacterium]|jgi:MerR family copper efflux transcriptional regulator|nr:MerR family transcriptional regulator [Lachnospiraceae bacterium]MCI8995665.1 MerR family transcriptional regulator [Lachnospiraceae bacterium]MCI9133087.1 MerR family transcriptional regulator [Lachnospiraceae bacterium]